MDQNPLPIASNAERAMMCLILLVVGAGSMQRPLESDDTQSLDAVYHCFTVWPSSARAWSESEGNACHNEDPQLHVVT
jgi:hypothetical protein